MNKRRKTIEELLEKSLVPEEEQPYKIPDNWVWVNSGAVLNFVGGGTPSKSNKSFWNGNVPWATVKDIKERYLSSTIDNISVEGLKNSSASMANPEELLLITRMAPGKSTITKISTTINQDLKIVRPKIEINSYFLWLFFTMNTPLIESMSTGSTVKGIQVEKLKKIAFPVPPINEQKRIVEKVEHLLNKIGDAKQLIEEAKETFELRRASIIQTVLREGLEGSELPVGWENVKIEKLFNIFGGGTPSKAKHEYWNGDIPWISAKDMKTSYISNTVDYITNEGLENSSAKLAKKGSIAMVVRSGILQRTLPVAYLLTECTLNQDLKVFDSGDELINRYFMWYIKGNEKSLLHNYSKSGTTVNSIDFQKFKSHELILPPMDVLRNKVDKIETAIKKEAKAEEVLNLTETIEKLKSSILSKAVKGELGTNDSTEESAIELLKEVLQEQVE